mmetsp:Transcript_13978/g.33007  ORF Transcript_13978/g.33007 Transcript_13978/m.33007 type:complete len:268 (-) Transcript_13978:275-1078(-)
MGDNSHLVQNPMPGAQSYAYAQAPAGSIPGGMSAYPQMPQYSQAPQPTFMQHPQPQSQHANQLKDFWVQQMQEVEKFGTDPAEFKNHQLPLARIKKIMKSDEDVRMISAEAPALFAKACEMFILEITIRSWIHSEENKRRTLQRNDIAAAITKTDIFDFLVDIVPREDKVDVEGGMPVVAHVPQQPPLQQPQQHVQHMQPVAHMPYYMPSQTGMMPAMASEAMMRSPMDPGMMYGGPQYMPRMSQQWPQQMAPSQMPPQHHQQPPHE